MIKLHKLNLANDSALLDSTGIKLYEELYCKVQYHLSHCKIFCYNRPLYAYPLFKTRKILVKELLLADVTDIPVRLFQSAGNIPTSRITVTFLKFCFSLLVFNFVVKERKKFAWRSNLLAKVNKERFEKNETKATFFDFYPADSLQFYSTIAFCFVVVATVTAYLPALKFNLLGLKMPW